MYEFGNTTCTAKQHCLNRTWFDHLTGFAKDSGAALVFGLNIDPTVDGHWDPTNAEELITYAIANDVSFYGFELGNEQNAGTETGLGKTADEEVRDFGILQALLEKLYPDAATRPKLIGPDTHGFHDFPLDEAKLNFLIDFVAGCRANNITLHAATHHE